jgi:hypothetical protein
LAPHRGRHTVPQRHRAISLEAWGNEGNVPAAWEDTAMRADFDRIVNSFRVWRAWYAIDMPNDEAKAAAKAVLAAMDSLADDHMTGRFE